MKGQEDGDECSIQMEGYYENILPVAPPPEATGRQQATEQASATGNVYFSYND
jgi:hypothetical protein